MAIFLFQVVDRVTISRMLGTHQLGLYAFVLTLGSLPATYAVRAFNTVLLPSYTSPGVDPAKQRELFLRAVSYVAALGFLFAIGVVGLGGYFLEAAYGDKWMAAIAAFSLLATLGVFRAFSALTEDLIVAVGRPEVFRKINWLRLLLAAGGVWFGATRGGITGVAVVMTAATAVACVVGWFAAGRLTGFTLREFGSSFRGPLIAGAMSALLLWLGRGALPDEPGLAAFVIAGTAVAVVFVILWVAVDGGVRGEWLKLVRRGKTGAGTEGA
jgi:O-antigen/teichoic acid export membrane protein